MDKKKPFLFFFLLLLFNPLKMSEKSTVGVELLIEAQTALSMVKNLALKLYSICDC
jgi:hypothetical protein